jgi:hypothetical protein
MRLGAFREYWLPVVALTVLAYALYLGLWDVSAFLTFQERDLGRAYALLAGEGVPYGPEVSGGGHLPGNFYYRLLALPLRWGADWTAAWHWMIFLSALAGAALFVFVHRWAGATAALFTYAVYLLSPALNHNLISFINPSFAPLFMVLPLLATAASFSSTGRRADLAWLAACFLLGLALQLHFSAILILLCAALLQALRPDPQLRRIPWPVFLAGLAVLLTPLLPYLLRSGAFAGAGTWRAAPAWLLTDVLQDSNIFGAWKRLPELMPLELAACLLLVVRGGRPAEQGRGLEKVLLLALALALPALLKPLFFGRAARYAVPFALIFAPLAGIWAGRRLKGTGREIVFLLGAAVLLLLPPFLREGAGLFQYSQRQLLALAACCGAASWWLRRHGADKRLATAQAVFLGLIVLAAPARLAAGRAQGRYPPLRFGEAFPLARRIAAQTAWPYEELRKRLFYVDVAVQNSLEHVYRLERARRLPGAVSAPDGYFVSTCPAEPNSPECSLASRLPEELARGLRSKALVLGPEERFGEFRLHPYFVKDLSTLPPYFQNVGYSFSTIPEAEILSRAPLGASRAAGGATLLKWNQCEKPADFCDIGFLLTLSPRGRSRSLLTARLFGAPLSSPTDWNSPTWTQTLDSPYLLVDCGTGPRKLPLASSVGFRDYRGFLAPFERVFELPCSRPRSLGGGWRASTASQLSNKRRLGAAELTARLD